MSTIHDFLSNSLNYVAVYDSRKHRIVSVPRVKSPMLHVGLTILVSALGILSSGVIAWGIRKGFNTMFHFAHYPWYASLCEYVVSAFVLLFFFLWLCPRLGMYPGLLGGKMILDPKSKMDDKLADLIKKFPRRLNVDWFRDWAEAETEEKQERLYTEMCKKLDYNPQQKRASKLPSTKKKS